MMKEAKLIMRSMMRTYIIAWHCNPMEQEGVNFEKKSSNKTIEKTRKKKEDIIEKRGREEEDKGDWLCVDPKKKKV